MLSVLITKLKKMLTEEFRDIIGTELVVTME